MVNKRIVIIVTIIAIIVVAGIVYISLNRETEQQYTFSEENVEDDVVNNVKNNTFIEANYTEENEENELEENTIESETRNEVENEKQEENVLSNSTEDTKEDKTQDEFEKLTGKDKAISLVKKEWGENDTTVYYYLEEQVSDDVYIISVRDQSTTQDLSSYKVDITSNTVEKN